MDRSGLSTRAADDVTIERPPDAALDGDGADEADQEPAGGSTKTGRPPGLSAGWITAAAALLAVLPYLYDAGRALIDGGHGVLWGDGALEELATRDVWRWHQLLGPYSRFGWHHPGPALFYWLALPDRLLGSGGPGTEIGIILLNGAAAAAIVVLLGRRWGHWLAVWAAGCVLLLHLILGGAIWRDTWNPFAVIMPMTLMVVLAADGATGAVASWCWALVAGSFAVQTHISTGAVVVVVLAASLGGLVWMWRTRRGVQWAAWWASAGLALAILMWIPPLIDAVRHHPSNLSLILKFFTARHPVHSLFEATRTSLTAASTVFLGRHGSLGDVVIRSTGALVLGTVLLLAVIIATSWVGIRRGSRLGLWLMCLSVIGIAVAVLSGTRVVGDIAQYLVIWQASFAITLLLGLGAAVLTPEPSAVPLRRHSSHHASAGSLGVRVASIIAAAGTVAAAAVAVGQQAALAGPTSFPGYAPPGEDRMASDAVRSALRPSDRVVRLTIATQSAWPTVAGVALELERGGRRTTEVATPGYGFDATVLFGLNRRPTGREDVDVEFERIGPNEVQGAPAHGQPLATLGSLVLLINRRAP